MCAVCVRPLMMMIGTAMCVGVALEPRRCWMDML